MKIVQFITGFWDLICPPRCAGCDNRLEPGDTGAFCSHCISGFEWLSAPLCRLCGTGFNRKTGPDSICGQCLRVVPAYSLARSLLRYTPQVQLLIHHLKYKKDLSVVAGISELASSFDMSRFEAVDYILPVPLHIERLRKRGWNQAIILAKIFFASHLQRIKVDWLMRKENTVEQTNLSGKARRLNLKTAFGVAQKAQLQGATICLVDDVFTTGTTVNECCKVIAEAGAKEILVLTLARADVPQGK